MRACRDGAEDGMQDVLKLLLQIMKPACAGKRRLSRMALEYSFKGSSRLELEE